MQTPLHISFLYLKGSGSLKIPIVSSLIPVDLYIHWNAFVFCLLLSLRGLQFQYADYFVFESWDSFPCLLMIFVLIYQKLKGLPENAFRMSYCQKQAATPLDYNITKLAVTDKNSNTAIHPLRDSRIFFCLLKWSEKLFSHLLLFSMILENIIFNVFLIFITCRHVIDIFL